MNKCKTCKYWKAPQEKTHKLWPTPKAKLLVGECSNPNLMYADFDSIEVKSDSLVYSDYEDYNAFLLVGPDFGCVHHDPAS